MQKKKNLGKFNLQKVQSKLLTEESQRDDNSVSSESLESRYKKGFLDFEKIQKRAVVENSEISASSHSIDSSYMTSKQESHF